VMSRSTQVVSFSLPCYYHNMLCEIIYDSCMRTHTHTRYSVSSSATNREKEKRSSFYVCRWEIIGFVKGTTQTVE
jgi:hypothetical protein